MQSAVTKERIAKHYNLASPFYRLLWGQHIHHGYWPLGYENLSSRSAQIQLISALAHFADIPIISTVLDVGCGLGGSSFYLAERLGCHVHGLTISRFQCWWARMIALLWGYGDQARFDCQDIETCKDLTPVDVVWSIECTEHLFNKPVFINNMFCRLHPGGKVILAAWLKGEILNYQQEVLVQKVCDKFLCPSLGSATDYQTWMLASGFRDVRFLDVTDRVAKTWEICLQRVQRSRMTWLAKLAGRDMTEFLNGFADILEAYKTGAMRYGFLCGTKPASGRFEEPCRLESLPSNPDAVIEVYKNG